MVGLLHLVRESKKREHMAPEREERLKGKERDFTVQEEKEREREVDQSFGFVTFSFSLILRQLYLTFMYNDALYYII